MSGGALIISDLSLFGAQCLELGPAQPGKFRTISADPPWPEKGGGKIKRGADRHYPTMTVAQICALGYTVRQLVDLAGCHLYLWATNTHLPDGFLVMAAWGFRYVNVRSWFKGDEDEDGEIDLENAGLGQYFRGETEHLLFGICGSLPYRERPDNGKRAQVGTAIVAPRHKHAHKESVHSAKPPSVRKDIELVSHGPYLEMFCRDAPPGWSAWGNEVDSQVEIEPAPLPQLGLFGSDS